MQSNQGLSQVLGQPREGAKQSGVGPELSLEGMLDSFTRRENVTINLGAPPRSRRRLTLRKSCILTVAIPWRWKDAHGHQIAVHDIDRIDSENFGEDSKCTTT